MENQTNIIQNTNSEKEKKIQSLKIVKTFLIIELIMLIGFIGSLIWYFTSFVNDALASDFSTLSVGTIVSIVIFIIFTILYGIFNLASCIIILVTGTKHKETKEVAIIFGILGIFFSFIFVLIYYFVAKNKIINSN